MLSEIAAGIRFGNGEEAIIEPDLSFDGVGRADPMNCSFDLSIRCWAAGFAVEVGGAAKLSDVSARIFHDFLAFDDIGVLETHFTARPQKVVFWQRAQHQSFPLA